MTGSPTAAKCCQMDGSGNELGGPFLARLLCLLGANGPQFANPLCGRRTLSLLEVEHLSSDWRLMTELAHSAIVARLCAVACFRCPPVAGHNLHSCAAV